MHEKRENEPVRIEDFEKRNLAISCVTGWIDGLDEAERKVLLSEVEFHIHRYGLFHAKRNSQTAVDQMAMVFEALEKPDVKVVEDYGTSRQETLSKYRDNFLAALRVIKTKNKFDVPDYELVGWGQEVHKSMVVYEDTSREIRKRLGQPSVRGIVERLPHVKGMLDYYADYLDISDLMLKGGVNVTSRRSLNDCMKGLVFGERRPGESRPLSGVKGVRSWSRKLLLANWLNNGQDAWGNMAEVKLAKTINLAMKSTIPYGSENFATANLASRFFSIVLQREYQWFQERWGDSPIWLEKYFVKNGQNGFEGVDVSKTYDRLDSVGLVPETLKQLVRLHVEGASISSLKSKLDRAIYGYSDEIVRSWVVQGFRVIEASLLSQKKPKSFDQVCDLSVISEIKKLKKALNEGDEI